MTTGEVHERESADRAEAIRQEIQQTRVEILETVDAIQDRFRPSRVLSRATSSMASKAAQTVRGVQAFQREHGLDGCGLLARINRNPMAAGFIAGSVILLTIASMTSRRRSRRYRRAARRMASA
ncbi:MAG TPA: DUF3618 domain-containing protein [Vicinamibacterales bacterium]|nr:DUF3618 domain-containing protein [Vicinamibacterales bacterium]